MKILIETSGKVRELEEGYASEYELQVFLRDYAALIPMDEIGSGTLPLLCVGFEVNVSSGSQDLLYVDHQGMLTIIETKLRRNPEVRREVVGQILEYAADAALWTQSDIEERAGRFFASTDSPDDYRNLTLRTALKRFLGEIGPAETEDSWYDAFVESMRGTLERGNIRLIIAVDEIHPSLLRTVEFINRFSERFEMYLFQLRRFQDAATKANIFVPALFGRVESRGAGRKRRQWDERSFKEDLRAKTDGKTVAYAEEIYEKFNQLRDVPLWGTGITYGSFNLVLLRAGRRVNLAAITSVGDLWIHFGWIVGKIPDEIRIGLFESLRAIPGVGFTDEAAVKWPTVPKAVLKDTATRKAVLEAIERAVDQIHSTQAP